MQELIMSVVLMYAAVGAAAFWYRRQLSARAELANDHSAANHTRTEGTD